MIKKIFLLLVSISLNIVSIQAITLTKKQEERVKKTYKKSYTHKSYSNYAIRELEKFEGIIEPKKIKKFFREALPWGYTNNYEDYFCQKIDDYLDGQHFIVLKKEEDENRFFIFIVKILEWYCSHYYT